MTESMRPTLFKNGVLPRGGIGRGREIFARQTCERLIDLCKRMFSGDDGKENNDWQQVKWQDWCTMLGRVLTEYHFPDLPHARQCLWGRVDINNNTIPVHQMALEGNQDMVVLGVLLAQDKSWVNLVSSLGGLLHSIIRSSCSAELVRFVRSKGCDPKVFDHRGDNAFHVAAMRGRCDVIDALFSEISAADRAHPTYLVTAESVNNSVDLNKCYNACGILPIHSPFLNESMSREVLVQIIFRLKDLGGARLDVCDGKNGYTLHQFCIARTGNDLGFMLNNLCPFGSTRTDS